MRALLGLDDGTFRRQWPSVFGNSGREDHHSTRSEVSTVGEGGVDIALLGPGVLVGGGLWSIAAVASDVVVGAFVSSSPRRN